VGGRLGCLVPQHFPVDLGCHINLTRVESECIPKPRPLVRLAE
jgi:hypothetical protein